MAEPKKDDPKLNPIITKPKPGLTYNPVTPEKLAQIAADWQKMSQAERDAATRNQAAALAAAERAQARKDREREFQQAYLRGQRERQVEAYNLRKRQEKEALAEKKQFNKEQYARQQQRLTANAVLRQRNIDKLKVQRANEARLKATTAAATKARNAAASRNRAIQQANAAAAAKTKTAGVKRSVNEARKQGLTSARDYFSQQGSNVGKYGAAVNQEIARLLRTLNPGEQAPADLTKNVGQDVYNTLQQAGRSRADATNQQFFGTGFEDTALPGTSVDSALNTIRDEQFADAQGYIDNLLKRGVITQPGYNKSLESLKGQIGQVDVQLGDIGKDILAGGRQQLTDIGNKAGTAAGNLRLGQTYNVNPYRSQMADAIKKFQTSLPGQIKTQIQGPLFDTSKLANIAGMATQGQNTAFDPYALSNTPRPTFPVFDQGIGMKSVF